MALGLPPLGELDGSGAEDFHRLLGNALRELEEVVNQTILRAKSELAVAAGFTDTDSGFQDLIRSAKHLRDRLDDPKARELCDRLLSTDEDVAEHGSLALVLMRSVETWTDADQDGFRARAEAICQEIASETRRFGFLPDPAENATAQSLVEELWASTEAHRDHSPSALLAALKRIVRKLEAETKE